MSQKPLISYVSRKHYLRCNITRRIHLTTQATDSLILTYKPLTIFTQILLLLMHLRLTEI